MGKKLAEKKDCMSIQCNTNENIDFSHQVALQSGQAQLTLQPPPGHVGLPPQVGVPPAQLSAPPPQIQQVGLPPPQGLTLTPGQMVETPPPPPGHLPPGMTLTHPPPPAMPVSQPAMVTQYYTYTPQVENSNISAFCNGLSYRL